MNPIRLLASLLLIAAASPVAADDTLKLSATADAAVVPLGGDVELELRLENPGAPTEVTSLQLEERSLSFTINAGGVTYVYTRTAGGPFLKERLPLPRVTLATGRALITKVRIPAIKTGPMKILALYNGKADAAIGASEVSVEVKAPETGGRLRAMLDVADRGAIAIDLDADTAPLSVTHFVDLAKRGFYRDMPVHRVIASAWIQTGCPYGLGIGGPDFAVKSESERSKDKDCDRGAVAFTTFEKEGYVGSQFLICTGKVGYLKGKHPIFGRVSEEASAKDILTTLSAVETDPTNDRPRQPLMIRSVTIQTVP